jgi:uncharacterized heparinase superfamily protein
MTALKAAHSVAQDVFHRVRRAWGESPFYQARLAGPAPDRLLFQPADPRAPDPAAGDAVIRGRFAVGADVIDCEGDLTSLWDRLAPGRSLFAAAHDFSWLRHLAAKGATGAKAARALTESWLDRFEKWSPDAWEPFLTGERLTQLCGYSDLLLKNSDALWRSRLLTAMARQTRHLSESSHRAGAGYDRLMTALALAIAALCLPGCEPALVRGLELLRRELRLQLRADGGHVSRNPSRQLAIVLRLRLLDQGHAALGHTAPPFLRHTLSRAAAALQFFRVGDGRLAVFHGGYEEDGRALAAALDTTEAPLEPTGFARDTGFQRLEAARTLLIVDTGPNMRPGYDSAGSFHFSSGRSRIVSNCGAGSHLPGDWERLLRQAPAHSSLATDVPLDEAAPPALRRAEDNRGQFLELTRIFAPGAGGADVSHTRRLYLAARGDNLRGEDELRCSASRAMWLRFHLHPSVKASSSRDGKSVVLALSNHEGWRFRANVIALSLEKSVYCGAGGLPVATQQIVIGPFSGASGQASLFAVKWAFQRLDGVG